MSEIKLMPTGENVKSNNNLKNGNAITNRQMYNYSRQGWCEAHWFYTPEMEFADDDLKFAQAPNGYIALLDNWYSGVDEYYIKIDGQWFELNDEAIEEVKAARMKKFEEEHGKARVEEIKKEVEDKVREQYNEMAREDDNAVVHGQLEARSEWDDGDNVFAVNYREKNNFWKAPVGAVAVIKSKWGTEYWKKSEDNIWRRVTHKEFIEGYKAYDGSGCAQIRKDVVGVVENALDWLDSEDGRRMVEEDGDLGYIVSKDTDGGNISIEASLFDGDLCFNIWTRYTYIEGEADGVENEYTDFSYHLDELDKEKIIADIYNWAARVYTDPADVCVGRRYRSSEGDIYTVTNVGVDQDFNFNSHWHIELESEDGTELWCERDSNDENTELDYCRWKISWNDTDEWIDFNDDDSLVL